MKGKGFKAGLGGLLAVVIAITVMLSASCARAPAPVIKIADMGWQSNVPVINIMKIILEDELGYEVEFVPTLWGPDTFAAWPMNRRMLISMPRTGCQTAKPLWMSTLQIKVRQRWSPQAM